MKQILLIVSAMLFCAVTKMGAQSISQMKKDILSQFENRTLSVMLVSEPGKDEPYYTFKVGENHEDHFATLEWFHVYTHPRYEIKNYSIITNGDVDLAEWRKGKGFKEDKRSRYIHLAQWTNIPNVSLPELNTTTLQGEESKKVNQDLRNFYESYLTEQHNLMKDEEEGHGPSASFSSQLNGDILSIVVEYDRSGFNSPNYKYKTYNINISTGRQASFEDLLKISGVTDNDVEKVIKAANNQQIKFSEGTITYRSLREIPVSLSEKHLIFFVRVENLPYGDGTYTKRLDINKWLPLCSSTQTGKTMKLK